MLRYKFDDVKLHRDGDGRIWFLQRLAPDTILPVRKFKAEFKGGLYAAETVKHRKKRSIDANNYLWMLCTEIAKALKSTKEEVYRQAVWHKGYHEIAPIHKDRVEAWMAAWRSRGAGWMCEIWDDSSLPDHINVINYFGSSVYTTEQMSLLIEDVVEEAEALGIDTLTPAERSLMYREHGKKKHTTAGHQ